MTNGKRTKPDNARRFLVCVFRSGRKHDTDWLLHCLKNSRADFGLMTFRGAIYYPNLSSYAAKILAHSVEYWSIKEARYSNEAGYPGIPVGIVIKNLPCCPAPEIDIKVTQVLYMRTSSPIS